jgi:hypothetical protein
MKQEITLKVPTSWEAVTLKDYLALRKDMETYKDEPEAITACLFHHLCHFPVQYLNQMDIDTYVAIKRDLESFFNKADHKLKRFITIDGVEYGFEPNLSNMAYGAYVDISKYETIGVDEKWAEIMSILYRPVTKKQGALYDIKVYNGELYPEKFMEVGMDVHFGALFFFKSLLEDLQKDTLNSLMELTELPRSIKSVLEKSGALTHQLSNWHKTIS